MWSTTLLREFIARKLHINRRNWMRRIGAGKTRVQRPPDYGTVINTYTAVDYLALRLFVNCCYVTLSYGSVSDSGVRRMKKLTITP